MSETNLERWHQHMKGELPGGLDELLHDDCAFYSPVVFTPQKGKALTKLYLSAAGNTFNDGEDKGGAISAESSFRYAKEVASGNHAVLEFESEIDGKYINGVDIITWDDDGKIIEFKVMVRPLQAVNMLHQKMQAMLETMQK
ncbi:MAG: nuclear transport factor 2 family protein [Oceanicoccus sp.]